MDKFPVSIAEFQIRVNGRISVLTFESFVNSEEISCQQKNLSVNNGISLLTLETFVNSEISCQP